MATPGGKSAANRILLIDDSVSVREVLRVSLEAGAYRVLEAADVMQGVRLYREHHPALVLVDIVMPEKDGLQTVREILAIDDAAIIFTMSGHGEDYQEVARRLGAKRGFEKPVGIEELLLALDGFNPRVPSSSSVQEQASVAAPVARRSHH